jgi:hypothetical protein
MKSERVRRVLLACVPIVVAGCISACSSERPVPPPNCCAAPGYSRSQVESVLGKPAPPQSSKWHPFPSPPPNAPVYTTEHGYVTVTYADKRGLATRVSIDFYEGKAPATAFQLAAAYLPPDAADTGARVSGARSSIRVYKSAQLGRNLPASNGLLYLECAGPNPAIMCQKLDVALGSP